MVHPIRWIKQKWNDYLDYDVEDWRQDYRAAMAEDQPTSRERARWGAPDPDFDYLFHQEETRPMARVDVHGQITTQDVSTVVMTRVERATRATEELPETSWVRQVLHEMDTEFLSRLPAASFDWTHPVYSRRHQQAVTAAATEDRLRFQQMHSPDWNEDWSDWLKTDVAAQIVARARHASDDSAPDTHMMPRVRV